MPPFTEPNKNIIQENIRNKPIDFESKIVTLKLIVLLNRTCSYFRKRD